jgi:hypothetical protein
LGLAIKYNPSYLHYSQVKLKTLLSMSNFTHF